jgi:predicted XRE-type DNA-binding protein
MKTAARKRLEADGWQFGDAADFFELTAEERAYVEMKLKLAAALREKRKARHMTQKQLAAKLKTSQPRIAYMEGAESDVSLDLITRALFALGATRREIAKAI